MSPFNRLGLALGADEREIKRAYAKALKATRPDEDPVAFQALNEAYQAALATARARGPAAAATPWMGAAAGPQVQLQVQMHAPGHGQGPEPVAMPAPAPVRDFNLDAFLREFTERCNDGHPDALIDWLHTVEALYDLELKQEVGAILHHWLAHDAQAPMPRTGQYQDLDRFFSLDFSSRLVPLNAARWAVANGKTTRYGERRPFAIRQLKRAFAWPRALLVGAIPGMNRRLGLLAWGLARDFGGIPPGIDPRQYEWYTRLANPWYVGRERWLSIAASAVAWGLAIAAATAGVLLLAGDPVRIGPLAAFGAVSTVVLAVSLACVALCRWLGEHMKTSEKLGWWLGAGGPLALAVLSALATRLSDPAPAYLLGGLALLFAIRHRSRAFDALRFYLASTFSLPAVFLPPVDSLLVLAAATAAATLVAVDAAYARRNALPFQATIGNRWVRVGSYIALAAGACVMFARVATA